jgi:hypothetical protein
MVPRDADGVSNAADGVAIKASARGAVIMIAWIGFLCLVMVLGAVNERDPRGLLLVLVWLPWLVPVALIARIRLSAVADVLTYRGAFRTRAWQRDQIECFGIIQSSWRPDVGHVQMLTRDGQCIIFRIASASRRREDRLQGWVAALEDWRSDAPASRYG